LTPQNLYFGDLGGTTKALWESLRRQKKGLIRNKRILISESEKKKIKHFSWERGPEKNSLKEKNRTGANGCTSPRKNAGRKESDSRKNCGRGKGGGGHEKGGN